MDPKRFYLDLYIDTFHIPTIGGSGALYDLLDFKQLKWLHARSERNRLTDPNVIFQFVEPDGRIYEGMRPEEYEWWINDPTDYMLRGFWPRLAGALAPLSELLPIWHINSYTRMMSLSQFASDNVIEALKSLIEAGKEAVKFKQTLFQYVFEMINQGLPPRSTVFCSAPFDYFGDYTMYFRSNLYESHNTKRRA